MQRHLQSINNYNNNSNAVQFTVCIPRDNQYDRSSCLQFVGIVIQIWFAPTWLMHICRMYSEPLLFTSKEMSSILNTSGTSFSYELVLLVILIKVDETWACRAQHEQRKRQLFSVLEHVRTVVIIDKCTKRWAKFVDILLCNKFRYRNAQLLSAFTGNSDLSYSKYVILVVVP